MSDLLDADKIARVKKIFESATSYGDDLELLDVLYVDGVKFKKTKEGWSEDND